MKAVCSHCKADCTAVAMVGCDEMPPEPVCYECAVIIVELLNWITRHSAPVIGAFQIEFLPVGELAKEDLQ